MKPPCFGLNDVGGYNRPTLADIDADGDLDAFVGNTLFYRNIGSANNPVFAKPETNPFGLKDIGSSSLTLGDIDGDGDLDAFIGNKEGNLRFFLNTAPTSNPQMNLDGNQIVNDDLLGTFEPSQDVNANPNQDQLLLKTAHEGFPNAEIGAVGNDGNFDANNATQLSLGEYSFVGINQGVVGLAGATDALGDGNGIIPREDFLGNS